MADLYALPDTTTPFRSEAEMLVHLSSWRYANDSAFREACEAKMALTPDGTVGTSTLQTKTLSGRSSVATDDVADDQPAGDETSVRPIGIVTRVTFASGATEKAMGEATQRVRDASAAAEGRNPDSKNS